MKKIIITLIILAAIPIITIPLVFVYALMPVGNKSEKVYFEIKSGDTVSSVATRLKEEGIIKYTRFFKALSRHYKYDRKIKYGYYELNLGMNMIDILKYLNEGKQVLSKFTITEGKNIYDIADILDKGGFVKREDFLKIAHDKNILDSYQIPAKSVEGYLFPSTYYIVKGNSAEKYITLMLDTFFKTFPRDVLLNAAKKRSLTVHELITMASIIEKETGINDDPAMIASVFYNRLKVRMRLMSDPTTIYSMVLEKGKAIEKPNIKTNDLLKLHPYNTYKVAGLPPGPISSISKKSLNAAVNPSNTEYYYFVADGSGTSMFSKDYETHLKYIDKYILKK